MHLVAYEIVKEENLFPVNSILFLIQRCNYSFKLTIFVIIELQKMSVFRKAKSADLQASLAKFTDMSKDCVSRVKHLKLLLDGLSVHVGFSFIFKNFKKTNFFTLKRMFELEMLVL